MSKSGSKISSSVYITSHKDQLVSKRKIKNLDGLSDDGKDAIITSLQHQLVELELENAQIKRLNSETEKVKTKFEDLYNQSPNGYFTFDRNGYVIDVNNSGSLMLAHTKDTILNKLFHVFILKEYWPVFNSFFQDAFTQPHKQTCEIKLVNKNGQIFWAQLESIVIFNSEDGTAHCRTAIFDVTERKQAENKIRSKQQHLKTAQKVANIGNWTWDFKEKQIIGSDQLYRIFDIEIQEKPISPRYFLSRLNQDYRDIVISGLQHALNTGESFDLDLKITTEKNIQKTINFRAKPELNEKGVSVKLFGIFQDITERKEIENILKLKTRELNKSKNLLEKRAIELNALNTKLLKSEEELKVLNENKDKFFAIISHNLRNPFTILLGLSELLASDIGSLDKNQIEKIAIKINDNANRIYNLLNNLLNWSKLQLGKSEFIPKSIDLNDCLNRSIGLLRDNASKKEINLNNQIINNLKVFSDENLLESVLQNLLTNAIKFSHKNSEIKIEAVGKENFIAISVIDQGIGMNKKVAFNLFKLEKSRSTLGTDKEQGTGLGLLICKELVEKQGGELTVESEEGKGSKFTFTVPLYK